MTEPERKDEFKFLDDPEDQQKRGGYTGKIMVGLVVLALGLASSLWWGKSFISQAPSKTSQPNDPKNDPKSEQYAEVINFAEKFTIMAFNVSYTDINRQTDKMGNLMSDNMMSYYQEAFLDSKWITFMRDNRAYVSYQQVERSTVENSDDTHYWVRVIGKCLFNSDTRGPGSQIELPFNLVVVVKNDNGHLSVTNFQRL